MTLANLEIVLDCIDPEALAPFWAGALGYKVQGFREPYLALIPEGGEGPRFILQRVPEKRPGKNRMHVDIKTHDMEGEAARLEKLGATRITGPGASGGDWIVMCDPEGNELCVCQE